MTVYSCPVFDMAVNKFGSSPTACRSRLVTVFEGYRVQGATPVAGISPVFAHRASADGRSKGASQ
jgi:hypothetical protein